MLNELPNELFLHVASYLDPKSLKVLCVTSKGCRNLVNDETAWKSAFLQNFKTHEFPAIAPTWRSEYSIRSGLLQRYQRGRGRNILYDAKIGNLTLLHFDFQSFCIIAGNTNNGLVSISDSETGKVHKGLVYPGTTRLTSAEVCCMRVSKTMVVYGFLNGTIGVNLFAKNSDSASFKTFSGAWHAGPVLALAVAPNFQVVQENCPSITSGGLEGDLRFWNHRNTRLCLGVLHISEHSIMRIVWDSVKRDQAVVMTTTGELYLVNGVNTMSTASVRLFFPGFNSGVSEKVFMEVDWQNECVIVANQKQVLKCSISVDSSVQVLAHGFSADITCICLTEIEVESDRAMPGSGARFLAVSANNGCIAIFNVRSESTEPVTVIGAQSDCITALAINGIVCAAGGIDGSVTVHNILDGRELRPIATRISKFQRIAQEDADRTKVSAIVLNNHTHPSGAAAIGGHIKSFDFDPHAERANGKRKGLNRRKHTVGPSTTVNGKYLIREEIREDMEKIDNDKRIMEKEHLRLQKLAGNLASELSEEEVLQYAQMLSQAESKVDRRGSTSITDDQNLAEAVKRSLSISNEENLSIKDNDDDPSSSCSVSKTCLAGTSAASEPASQKQSSYQEDLELALALSLVDN